MGCGGAKHVQLKDEAGEDSPSKPSSSEGGGKARGAAARGRFVADEYSVGKKIGEGTFGVVRRAHKRGQKEPVYAIKFIDKAMQSHDIIMTEIDIIMRLDHPHVVKCYSVVEEPAFTCAVMELWPGTDVASLLMNMVEQNEFLLEGSAVNLVQQMLSAISYVHSMDIIHRDIKCDNYLSDRTDLTDSKVRLGLADFGCAAELPMGKRCTEDVGTPFYKSPEMLRMDYSHSADVWAVGICFYVLLNLAFPFEGEEDILSKEPMYGAGWASFTSGALRAMLAKREKDRATAEEALEMLSSPMIKLHTGKSGNSASTGSTSGAFQIRKVCQKIIDRRDVLMSRARQKRDASGTPAVPILPFERTVERVDGTPERLRFEWLEEERLDKKHLAKPRLKGAMTLYGSDWHDTFTDISWLPATVAETLKGYGIDATQFPTGHGQSGLEGLVDELRSGVSQLMQDATQKKTLVRVMRSLELQIMVVAKGTEQVLVRTQGVFSEKGRLPSKIWRTCETMKEAVRSIVEASGLEGAGVMLMPNLDNMKETIERSDCLMYPGLELVTRRYVVPATVFAANAQGSTRIGLHAFTSDSHKVAIEDVHHFKLKGGRWDWWSMSKCTKAGMQILSCVECQMSARERGNVSFLFPEYPKITEKEVEGLLVDNDLDLSVIGDQTASALTNLAAEISEGYCILGVSHGQLLRIADVVVLHVEAGGSGLQLVEVAHSVEDGEWTLDTRRPGTKKGPLEEDLDTVRRICEDVLGWDFDSLHLMLNKTCTSEEVKSSKLFPGLPTLYRKHSYFAEVTPASASELEQLRLAAQGATRYSYAAITGDDEDQLVASAAPVFHNQSMRSEASGRAARQSEYVGHTRSKKPPKPALAVAAGPVLTPKEEPKEPAPKKSVRDSKDAKIPKETKDSKGKLPKGTKEGKSRSAKAASGSGAGGRGSAPSNRGDAPAQDQYAGPRESRAAAARKSGRRRSDDADDSGGSRASSRPELSRDRSGSSKEGSTSTRSTRSTKGGRSRPMQGTESTGSGSRRTTGGGSDGTRASGGTRSGSARSRPKKDRERDPTKSAQP